MNVFFNQNLSSKIAHENYMAQLRYKLEHQEISSYDLSDEECDELIDWYNQDIRKCDEELQAGKARFLKMRSRMVAKGYLDLLEKLDKKYYNIYGEYPTGNT